MRTRIIQLIIPALLLCLPLAAQAGWKDVLQPDQLADQWLAPVKEYLQHPLSFHVQEAAVDGVQATTGGQAPEVNYLPNYEKNLTLFYWFMTAMLVILIAILVVSGTLKTFIRSDVFKERLKDNKYLPLLVLGLLFTGAIGWSNQAYSLSFNISGDTNPEQPWLLVEKQDLYFLAAIDFVLLGVLIYIRRMLNHFVRMVFPQKETTKVRVSRKLNRILTDTVPIEEESEILMHHEYDGIRELDNNLPPWWVWGFYASIAFAVIYLLNYHILGLSDLQIEAYKKDMVAKQKEVDAYLSKMAMNVDEKTAVLLEEKSDLDAGKSIFTNNCIACHLDDGSGKIGPNLTDKNWIYGYDIKEVFATIKYGTANGMPDHNSKLNPVQIQQVASFVLSLPEKAGKPAEGEIIEP